MKRTIPLLITALAGFVLIISFFIPATQLAGEAAAVWFDILAAIAFVLGGGNLLRLHLQKVSDKKAGWGYSAVTLVAFLLMLTCGMLKLGSPPEQHLEQPGDTFVPFSLANMPEFRVDGVLPSRPDHARLPASVHGQFRTDGAELVFQGWMRPNQRDDLLAYHDSLSWRCAVETLFDRAQPPESLRGRVAYYVEHEALSFSGMMTEADAETLKETLDASPETSTRIDRLFVATRRETSVPVIEVPPRFSIPESAQGFLTLSEDSLQIRGPMSPQLRDQVALTWPRFDRVRPLTAAQHQELLTEIEERGPALNDAQRETFERFFDADWKADQLIQAINTAGTSSPTTKTACELLAEVDASQQDPPTTIAGPPAVVLTPEQEDLVRQFVDDPTITPAELVEQLEENGLGATQAAAASAFLQQAPTVGSKRRELCFQLLERGPLSADQRNFLFQESRDEFQWRQTVGRLFAASHQVKHPWSGSYSADGTPFWWMYTYIMQPLMTTTFAMLAFYVASAAFRAFRAKNLDAVLLLGTAFIILLGRTFAGYLLTSWAPESLSAFKIDQLTIYIMTIFATGGNRAIMIGIALGIASTSLKVLLGIDRSYLGSGDD